MRSAAALKSFRELNKQQAVGLICVAFLLIAVLASPAAGQTSEAQQPANKTPPAPSNPFSRAYLFGDWGGSRSAMAKHGINFDAIFTQFGQGLSNQEPGTVANYANKFDLYANVDTEKAHLWRGGGIAAHMEIRYGDAPQGLTLFPTNTAMYTPSSGANRVALTSLYFTQKLNDKSALIFGKISTIDLLAAAPFVGGRGLDGFMHIAFAAPPTGVTPVSTYGVIAKAQFKKTGLTFFVYDPTDQTASNKQPFKEGVNFSVIAAIPGKSFGHNATHTISGAVSTISKTDLNDLPESLLPPANRPIGTSRGPFNLYYQYEQYLYQNPNNPRSGWGLFARVGVADGNPNPIQNLFLAGIGGTELFHRRAIDRFGVGYFRYGLSNALKNALLAPPVSLHLNNEIGAEAFYNYAVTRWLRLTADLQVLPPTLATKGTSVYGAVRAKVSF